MKKRVHNSSLVLVLILVIIFASYLGSIKIEAAIENSEEQSFEISQIWWDADWPYRMQINITNDGEPLTDYQVHTSLCFGASSYF